jgi:CubicO group peptidase (beta-lactamase class C family)
LNSGKLASLIAIAAAILTGAAEPADSAHGWIKATPEEVGMDSAAIAEMIEFSREQRIPVHSVQIIRNGKLALDAYFYPYDGSTRHDVASVTKSVTSILVGLAIEGGQIANVKEPAAKLVGVDGASSGRPNVEDLLTMRSGWDCGSEPKEARLFEMRRSAD